jgi:hypothetical protein
MRRIFLGSPPASAWQLLQVLSQASVIWKLWWLLFGSWHEVHCVPPTCESGPT